MSSQTRIKPSGARLSPEAWGALFAFLLIAAITAGLVPAAFW